MTDNTFVGVLVARLPSGDFQATVVRDAMTMVKFPAGTPSERAIVQAVGEACEAIARQEETARQVECN